MKRLILWVAALLVAGSVWAQPKANRPTIMVMPSDQWCIANGYVQEFDNQGVVQRVPDYRRALQENADLLQVISKLNNQMIDRGFPLKNLETELQNLELRQARQGATQSSQGATLQRSLYEEINTRVTVDIKMQITWDVKKQGPRKFLAYNLQGLDAYTNKQVAGADGISQPSSEAIVPKMLEDAILSHMDDFADRLQRHFDDMFANGREMTLILNVFDTSAVNLETEFNGYMLSEIIENYLADHTVNSSYTVSDMSTNFMLCEQVRIPMLDANQRPLNATRFAQELRRYLRNEPYKILSIQVQNQGLGQVTLNIGDK